MTDHADAKSIRTMCLKLAKGGLAQAGYKPKRERIINMCEFSSDLVPNFIVTCETGEAAKLYFYTMFPSCGLNGAYKRRKRYILHAFAALIFFLERDDLSHEMNLLRALSFEDRYAMDYVLHLMRDCAETDPSRSILLSKHVILDVASYLLGCHGVHLDGMAEVKKSIEQICDLVAHPPAGSSINFSPDRSFVASMIPLAEYIDRQDIFYSCEIGNRSPKRPSTDISRQVCHSAILLCEMIWHWTMNDHHLTLLPRRKIVGETKSYE